MRARHLEESEFKSLAAHGGIDLISLLIPTHDKGREIAQDKIKFKNRIQQAEAVLEARGKKPRERSERLSPAKDLLDDGEFWEHQRSGLAAYLDEDGGLSTFALSRPVTEASHVLPVFQVRPLVGEIRDFRLSVLVLTRGEVALLEATTTSVDEIEGAFPNMEEVNWFVDREKQRQQHPGRAGSSKGRHGHGTADGEDEDLLRFLREVDSSLDKVVGEKEVVVLGDDDLVARFANQTDLAVHSPDNSGIASPISEETILERTASLLTDRESKRVADETQRLRDRVGQGLGSTSLEESLAASRNGRVETLLVHRTADPRWGRFDEQTQTIEEHPDHQSGDVDLLDRLVVWCFESGADLVPTEEPIGDRPFLTSFRY